MKLRISRFKKKTSTAREPIDYFAESLQREGFDIKILDRKEIVKKCGKGLFDLFKSILIEEAEFNRLLFICREKEKESFWYSVDSDRIVVNMVHSPDREKLQRTVKEAQEMEEGLKTEKEGIEDG